MRVSVAQGGGLLGTVVKTITAETDRLTPPDREKLAALVRQARLLEPSSTESTPTEPQPDRFTYRVEVQDEGKQVAHTLSESSLTPEVQELVSWVSKVDGRTEEITPAGQP
jgi:Emfourin